MKNRNLQIIICMSVVFCFWGIAQSCTSKTESSGMQLYDLGTEMESRSISFENPSGEPGNGGQEASNLGVGRKGFPAKIMEPGETINLCDISGTGTIRHIWMTGWFKHAPIALRSMVIRAYWENQEHPSVECPLGDFMGFAHAKVNTYQSAVHSIGINSALNIWLPMPFSEHARITLTNEADRKIKLFYQIDYTLGDIHPDIFGRLHVCFVRENPTTLAEDFEILPKRTGKGRFLGTVLGIRSYDDEWWGEGELKIYLDGDTEFPTICGTGAEDYAGLSFGMQQTPYLYHGCSLNNNGFVSMYRWHLPDPVYWNKECRITMQQLGLNSEGFYYRQDDWSSATFWYEPVPSAPLVKLPELKNRVANLWETKNN